MRLDPRVKRLLSLYQGASPEVVERGLGWYRDAHDWAKGISRHYGIPLDRVVGVLAALSPGNEWGRNKSDAEALIRAWGYRGAIPQVGSYGRRNTGKALRILEGEEPLEVLGGNKVRSFYRNILNPESEDAVTIDRHALSALIGRKLGEGELKSLTPKRYEDAVGAYRLAASKAGLIPSQFQAVIWEAWKNRNAA